MRAKNWAELYEIENTDEKGKRKKHTIKMRHDPKAEEKRKMNYSPTKIFKEEVAL